MCLWWGAWRICSCLWSGLLWFGAAAIVVLPLPCPWAVLLVFGRSPASVVLCCFWRTLSTLSLTWAHCCGRCHAKDIYMCCCVLDLVEYVLPVCGFAVCCVGGPLLVCTAWSSTHSFWNVWLGSEGDLLCFVGAHPQWLSVAFSVHLCLTNLGIAIRCGTLQHIPAHSASLYFHNCAPRQCMSSGKRLVCIFFLSLGYVASLQSYGHCYCMLPLPYT